MSDVRLAVVFLSGMIVCMVTTQVLLKVAGIHAAVRFDILYAFLGNPWLWGSLLTSGAGLTCWLITLRHMSLATAYPWTALIYVFTPLASAMLFGDELSTKYLLGMTSIVVGVVLTSRGVETL